MSSLLCQPLPRRHFFRIETKWLFFFYEVRCISKALCFNVNGTLHIILYTHKYIQQKRSFGLNLKAMDNVHGFAKKYPSRETKNISAFRLLLYWREQLVIFNGMVKLYKQKYYMHNWWFFSLLIASDKCEYIYS